MDSVTTGDAREHLAELINQVNYNKERIVLKRRSKPVAALVPLEDLERLEAMEDRFDALEAREALRDIALNGAIPWEQIKAKLTIKR